MQQDNKIRVNHYIKASKMKVIDENGEFLGIMSLKEALMKANECDQDLVEINSKSSPILCKIIDFGKYKYELKKQQADLRKSQKAQELKEITFRPNTDENDLLHKLGSAKEFLADGHKVKFTVRFRGREITHPEVAQDKLMYVLDQLKEIIAPPAPAILEGKFMFLVVSPIKK